MSDRPTLVAIDTNVILRYLVGDGGRLADKAAGILDAVADGHAAVCCDPVTLAETVWVLRSYYELPNLEIGNSLIPLVECPGFHVPGKSRYLTALKLLAEEGASFGDACACALALQECEGRLYSFDRKLPAIGGIDRTEALRKGT